MMSNHKLMRHVRSLAYLLVEDIGFAGVVYQNDITPGTVYGKRDVKLAAIDVSQFRILDQ